MRCWLLALHSQHTGRLLTCCPSSPRVCLSHLVEGSAPSSRQYRGNQSGIIGDAVLSKVTSEPTTQHEQPSIQIVFPEGASIYDVRTEGGGGQMIPQFWGQTQHTFCRQRGEGYENPSICGRHVWKPLNSASADADPLSSSITVATCECLAAPCSSSNPSPTIRPLAEIAVSDAHSRNSVWAFEASLIESYYSASSCRCAPVSFV